jgi:hypothetical protein
MQINFDVTKSEREFLTVAQAQGSLEDLEEANLGHFLPLFDGVLIICLNDTLEMAEKIGVYVR